LLRIFGQTRLARIGHANHPNVASEVVKAAQVVCDGIAVVVHNFQEVLGRSLDERLAADRIERL
jgi:hypothetical protein